MAVSLDGMRMRYELKGERTFQGETFGQSYVSAFNGVVSQSLSLPTEGSRETYPQGHILNESKCSAARLLNTQPIRWTLAIREPVISEIDLDSLRVSSRDGVIDGVACLILETTVNPAVPKPPPGFRGGGVTSYWVDPGQEYSIRRFTFAREGLTIVQIDASYELHPAGGWLPIKWTGCHLDVNGVPRTSSTITVESYEINPEFKPDEFEITFPPGTLVSDSRPAPGGGESPSYIVLEDGKKRIITPEDSNATYEELIASTRSPWSIRHWIIAANVGVLAVIVALVLRRRYK